MSEIKELEIETFIQATEDSEKVLTAIKNIFPPELREDNIEFIINKVRGVFHNPITVVRTKDCPEPKKIIEYIAQQLKESDKMYLFHSMDRRIEKEKMFLRLGKQELFQNRVEIKEIKDTVKIKITFSKKYSKVDKLLELLEEMGLIIR
ncbi:MAG TPA: RNA-binding domain-containing protein [Candidatus Deferrimicrobium sp.]|nr:RNA-binding domain-containing protein [Candidatus Deferrimicrobium sp.]